MLAQIYDKSEQSAIVGIRYPGKGTVLGISTWMAKQDEDRREVISLIDKLFTDAKLNARFHHNVQPWHIDIYPKRNIEEKTFIQWGCNTAMRIAQKLDFVLHFKQDEDWFLWYENHKEEVIFSIKFSFK